MLWILSQHALDYLLPAKGTVSATHKKQKLSENCWKCGGLGEATYSEDEYTIGRGEMEDLFILLISPAISY